MNVKKITLDQLVQAASQLFQQHGYSHTSMDNIAEACSIKKPSLYHHIASREALLVATLEYANAIFTDRVFAVAYQEELSAQERFHAVLDVFENMLREQSPALIIVTVALEVKGRVQRVVELSKQYNEQWLAMLRHLFAGANKSAIEDLANSTHAELSGLLLIHAVTQDMSYVRRVIASIKQRLSNRLEVATA